MDQSPDPEREPDQPWQAAPEPSDADLVRTSLRERSTRPSEAVRSIRSAFRGPRRALAGLQEFGRGLGSFGSFLNTNVESSLNGPIGPHRRWTWAETTIPEVKKVRAAHGGTVNDVVLSIITRGFRDLLLARGEEVEGRVVRTLVPVSVRKEDERGAYNNRVSAMFAELPVGLADPIERLEAIRSQMDDLKESKQAVAAETLTSLSGFAPAMLLALGARVFSRLEQHAVQTVTTNVPGPQVPLYAAGRRMLTARPYVPLAGSVRIGVAIFSYAGQLTFGITGDYEGAPDIDLLADGISAGMQELLERS